MSLEHEVIRLTRIPTTIAEITVLTGASRRDVEQAVQDLREAGEPIIGTSAGLRLVEDPDELAAYVQARRRRMLSEWRGTVALRRSLKRMREAQAESEGLTLWAL